MRLEHLLSGARRFPSGLGNGSMASRLYPLDMETYKGKEKDGAGYHPGKVDSPIAQLVRALH